MYKSGSSWIRLVSDLNVSIIIISVILCLTTPGWHMFIICMLLLRRGSRMWLAESMLGYQPVCLLCYWSPFSCYFCIYSEDWWYGRLDYVLLLCNYDNIYIDLCSIHVPGPLVGNDMCYGSADICFGRDDASNQLEWRGTPLTSYATINGMHALLFLLMELDRSCERGQPFFCDCERGQPGQRTVHMELVCINGKRMQN
jgi:hypothetical protein